MICVFHFQSDSLYTEYGSRKEPFLLDAKCSDKTRTYLEWSLAVLHKYSRVSTQTYYSKYLYETQQSRWTLQTNSTFMVHSCKLTKKLLSTNSIYFEMYLKRFVFLIFWNIFEKTLSVLDLLKCTCIWKDLECSRSFEMYLKRLGVFSIFWNDAELRENTFAWAIL